MGKIPSKGKIYSLNEGYEKKWEPAIYDFVRSKKEGPKSYSMRYIGSMVADVHRTIKYGGIFLYPKTADAPKESSGYSMSASPWPTSWSWPVAPPLMATSPS